MDRARKAIELIAACEAEIKQLIQGALAERRYEEIPQLASLASHLAIAVSGTAAAAQVGQSDDKKVVPAVSEVRRQVGPQDAEVKAKARHRRADAYPRFERQGDRLVKIGWSKKDRAEYEHKAPLVAVEAVIDAIDKVTGKGAYLRVEDILPVKQKDEEEVPSYQVYLVVAWLREIGAIERLGNDGYKVQGERASLDGQELWNQTPERR
jgi:hypothetical protein